MFLGLLDEIASVIRAEFLLATLLAADVIAGIEKVHGTRVGWMAFAFLFIVLERHHLTFVIFAMMRHATLVAFRARCIPAFSASLR